MKCILFLDINLLFLLLHQVDFLLSINKEKLNTTTTAFAPSHHLPQASDSGDPSFCVLEPR